MKAFDIKIEGIAGLQDILKKYSTEKLNELDNYLEANADNISNQQKLRVPRNLGQGGGLLSAINVKRGYLNYELVANKSYAAWVEWGTKRKVKVPPELQAYAATFKGKSTGTAAEAEANILEWVKRKKIRLDSKVEYKTGKRKGQLKKMSIEDTAFIIFQAIMKKGIKAQPFFFAPYLENKAKIIDGIKKIMK